jgi:hypothetical protein
MLEEYLTQERSQSRSGDLTLTRQIYDNYFNVYCHSNYLWMMD